MNHSESEKHRLINIINNLDIPQSIKSIIIEKLNIIKTESLLEIINKYTKNNKSIIQNNNIIKSKFNNLVKDYNRTNEEVLEKQDAEKILNLI